MEPLVISRCNVVSGASLGHWYWGGGHTTASAGHAIPGARGIGILDDTGWPDRAQIDSKDDDRMMGG